MEALTTLDQLFQCYESIAQVVRGMLKSAREDDWDAVIDLHQRYNTLVDLLRAVQGRFSFDMAQRARVEDLTRRILADEAQVRERAAPRLARLSALLESNRQTVALQKTYGLAR
jgi:flagellar protein FliT